MFSDLREVSPKGSIQAWFSYELVRAARHNVGEPKNTLQGVCEENVFTQATLIIKHQTKVLIREVFLKNSESQKGAGFLTQQEKNYGQNKKREEHTFYEDMYWFGKNFSPPLQEIHKRVMALSFRDCHTKIRHVDAHATLNEGVVVQVMGELSNNMQPMRKFMQTFVLAPEVCGSAKPFRVRFLVHVWKLQQCFCFLQGTVANKFYVHNDVFRYQDEVFGDSDSEPPEGEIISFS